MPRGVASGGGPPAAATHLATAPTPVPRLGTVSLDPSPKSRVPSQQNRMAAMKSLVLGTSLVSTLLLAAGCDGKVEQCNRLVAAMNHTSDELTQPGEDPAALEAVATKLDANARELGAVEVKLPELVKFRDDYLELLTQIAAGLRDAAEGSRSADRVRAESASRSMLGIGVKSGRLVEDINAFCGAR